MARCLPLLLLATVALLGITPIADGDVWWHLKFGEYFFQHRSFPEHDPFLFTAEGGHWVIRAWLAEVLFYVVFRLGGPAGLILLKAALFTLAMGLLWRLGAAQRCPPAAAALALLLAALAARPRLLERPEVFSFLLMAAALRVLLAVAAPPDGHQRPCRWWAPYLLIPLQILWVNMHSSFYLGMLLPWPFVIDAAAHRRSVSSVRHLLLAATLLLPASAVSPEGWRVFFYPFQIAYQPTLAEIEEVQGLITNIRGGTAGLQEGIALLVLGLGAIVVCLWRRAAGQWVGPGTWSLVALALGAPFVVYRFLPYAGLMLSAVALQALGALAAAGPEGTEAEPHLGGSPRPVTGVAVLLLGLTVFQGVRGSAVPFGLGVAPNLFPEGAARFIVATDARGPLFNSADFGGYLLYALYPRHRVFMHSDYQNSIASDQLVQRFYQSEKDPGAFDALVREYRIELLVLQNNLPSWGFVASDPRWALIYWEQVASVYARRGGANAALIAAHEFRVTRYAADLSYLLRAAQDPGLFATGAAELRRAAAEDPENMAARLSLAFLLKARGQDLPEALAAVEAAEGRGLRDATLLTWKAEILAGLGREGDAEAAAHEALRANPAARAARLVLADLRARAGDPAGAARILRDLLNMPDLSPDQRREAEDRLRALAAPR